MSSRLDAEYEEKQARQALRLLRVCSGGLNSAIGRAGGELTGFSAKMSGADVLLTVRAELPGGRKIAFVGGSDLAGALLKAYREASADELRWREDRWKKE